MRHTTHLESPEFGTRVCLEVWRSHDLGSRPARCVETSKQKWSLQAKPTK